MNLTLTVDDDAVEKARQAALKQGTSLQALLRDYIETLAGDPRDDELALRLASVWKHSDTASRSSPAPRSSAREALHDERFLRSKLGRRGSRK